MARLIVQGGLGPGPGGVPCDLDAAKGELFVLAGGPLAWTGRLLRSIAGLVEARLDISVGGKRVGDLPPDQRGLGFVFPDGALFPHLSVTDNVCFPLVSRNAPRYIVEERLAAVVEITGIKTLLGRHPGALSPLERLRVAVARALMREPGVLLLEDPLSSVSGSSRREMREELLQLHQKSGITFILSCAESWDAFALADRMALCVNGRVRQIGTPTELYEKPADRFVAALAGSPPMNILTLPVDYGRVTLSGWTMKVPEAPAVLGIRPEDLRLDKPETPALALRAEVKRIEREGLLARVLVDVDGHALQVRCESRRIPTDQNVVMLYCELPRLHLFAASGHGEQLAWDRERPITVEQLREALEAMAAAEQAVDMVLQDSSPPPPRALEEPSLPEMTPEPGSVGEDQSPAGMVAEPAASSALAFDEDVITMLEMTPFRAEPPPPTSEHVVDPVAEPFSEPPPKWETPPSEYPPVPSKPPSGEKPSQTDDPSSKPAAA